MRVGGSEPRVGAEPWPVVCLNAVPVGHYLPGGWFATSFIVVGADELGHVAVATEAHMNFSASPAHNRFAGSLLAAPPTSCLQVQRSSCAFLERVRADGGKWGRG
jgi:hypothetical protein